MYLKDASDNHTVASSNKSGYIVIYGEQYKISGLNFNGSYHATGGSNEFFNYTKLNVTSIEIVNPNDYF